MSLTKIQLIERIAKLYNTKLTDSQVEFIKERLSSDMLYKDYQSLRCEGLIDLIKHA